MSATTNQYKFSFILDLRNTEDDVAKVLEDIKAISAVGGETWAQEIGMRCELQTAAAVHYATITVSGAGTVDRDLKVKLRHDKRINRISLRLLNNLFPLLTVFS